MVCLVTEAALQGGLNMQQPVKLTPTLLSLARNTVGDEQLCSLSDRLTHVCCPSYLCWVQCKWCRSEEGRRDLCPQWAGCLEGMRARISSDKGESTRVLELAKCTERELRQLPFGSPSRLRFPQRKQACSQDSLTWLSKCDDACELLTHYAWHTHVSAMSIFTRLFPGW